MPKPKYKLDGFVDSATGLGALNTKGQSATYEAQPRLTADDIEAIYNGSWLARKVVETGPRYALSRGFGLDKDQTEEFRRRTYSPQYPDGMYLAAAFEGARYGGAALVLGSNQVETERTEGGENNADWLTIVNRNQIKELTKVEDVNSQRHGLPATFQITDNAHPRKELVFHVSRALWFQGVPTTGTRFESDLFFFSDSVLQPLLEELQRYGVTWAAVNTLIQEASVSVYKMKGFVNALGTQDQAEVRARMELMSESRSLLNSVFLDQDEDFTLHDVKLSGINDVLAAAKQMVAGGVDIPVSRLFHSGPQGLSATGEGDQVIFDQRISTEQETRHKPALTELLAALGINAEVDFPPLAEPTAEVLSENHARQAAADKSYIDTGGVDAIDVLLAREKTDELGFKLSTEAVARMNETLTGEQTDTGVNPLELIAPTQRAAILTVNEVRSQLGFAPVAGGDVSITELELTQKAEAEAETTISEVPNGSDPQDKPAGE